MLLSARRKNAGSFVALSGTIERRAKLADAHRLGAEDDAVIGLDGEEPFPIRFLSKICGWTPALVERQALGLVADRRARLGHNPRAALAEIGESGGMRGKLGAKRFVWYSALLGVAVAALWVPLYNRVEPQLAGIPFFYWFQFLLIVVAALITALAYRSGV